MVVADAPDTLALLFDNDDVEVRVDAAIGLGLTRAEAAVGYLRRRLTVESAPRVREQIERQLRAMGQPTTQPEKAPSPKKEAPMRTDW
jgi:HEAT repeat protein